MQNNIKEAVENYQCPGCVNGMDTSCYERASLGVKCCKHVAGTLISGIGKIYLGMPIGFNRIGPNEFMNFDIFETFDSGWGYDLWNIPVWKHLTKDGHVLVRGLSPRTNTTFIHIFLENCIDKIECLEISEEDISNMN